MPQVLKRRGFAKWQAAQQLPDSALCAAVQEMEHGLVDAHLGAQLLKKRIARAGSDKSGGYRTLVSARMGSCYVFLHGYCKNEQSNINDVERKALQFAGNVLLQLRDAALKKALQSGALFEVNCEQYH